MTIETKFNVLDGVHFIHNNKVQFGSIESIETKSRINNNSSIFYVSGTTNIYYIIKGIDRDEKEFTQKEIFSTKEELLASL